jgi:hypothetical protein
MSETMTLFAAASMAAGCLLFLPSWRPEDRSQKSEARI